MSSNDTTDTNELWSEGGFEQLRRAREDLDIAFEQARACGYQPGTLQMRALQLAETHCQQLEQKHRRDRSP